MINRSYIKIQNKLSCNRHDLTAQQYQIDEQKKIGKGATSKVYAGVYNKKSIAIKIPKVMNLEWDEAHLASAIEREIKILEHISHAPSYLTTFEAKFLIHYYGFIVDKCAIVLEKINGKSLAEYILDNNNTISLSEKNTLMMQIAQGIKALHQFGVIHCDLKPSNILLNINNQNITVKIMDFGLSKLTNEKRHNMGTPYYSGPEVLLHVDQNEKSDIYAMGLIFWQIITRYSIEIAFINVTNYEELVDWVAVQQKRPILPANCDSPIKELITRCWEVKPESRPAASECADTLNHFAIKKI